MKASEYNPSIQPALTALSQLRHEIKKRIGKEGGNLNEKMLGKIDTIEGVLSQIPSVQAMFSVINQQAQLGNMAFRMMGERAALSASSQQNDHDDDNGTSETKGE